ncbi:hypothetical protein CcCBS67573_g06602 [Chytriomyces confervae]|uniref:Uncharacterized protein n=1 Tax=Chytriomyces confervae TaxID=246404 RepID=A0A507F3L3_9FUNG|nr:hypothetical protein HDU80_010966 [Chytriomyces hyalinus]TPX70275.1 hypothetical protein CcCBS67573_g06602 [Chytriomyces confervae]
MDFLKQAEKALSSDAAQSAIKFLDSEKGSQVIDQVSHTVAPKAQADMAASALKGYVHSHNQSANASGHGGAIQQPQQQQPIGGQSEGQGHFVEPSGPPPSGAGAPAQGHAAAAGGNPLMDLAAGFLKR